MIVGEIAKMRLKQFWSHALCEQSPMTSSSVSHLADAEPFLRDFQEKARLVEFDRLRRPIGGREEEGSRRHFTFPGLRIFAERIETAAATSRLLTSLRTKRKNERPINFQPGSWLGGRNSKRPVQSSPSNLGTLIANH